MTAFEVGPDRTAMPVVYPDAAGEVAGQLAGYRITHPKPDGGLCLGAEGHWIPVGEGHWTLVSEDPLTLTPSLRCTVCGDHGFITNGAWVPA